MHRKRPRRATQKKQGNTGRQQSISAEKTKNPSAEVLPSRRLQVPKTGDTKLWLVPNLFLPMLVNSHVRILGSPFLFFFVARVRLEHLCSGRCSSPPVLQKPSVSGKDSHHRIQKRLGLILQRLHIFFPAAYHSSRMHGNQQATLPLLPREQRNHSWNRMEAMSPSATVA